MLKSVLRNLGCLIVLTLLLSACGADSTDPLPTRTPAPTFTPTSEGGQAITVVTEQSTTDTQTEPAPEVPQTNNEQQQPTPVPVEEPTPTLEPAPTDPPQAEPELTVNSGMNVRGGPGTNYNIIGSANAGERFRVTGKNNAGDWWQVDFNGQRGWMFGQLVTPVATESVQVASDIPAPPPPTNTPIPVPTNTPVPAQPTAPPPPTRSPYEFNVAVAGNCARQEAGTWFSGKTYKNGQPKSGYKVVFSYAPDGPHVTNPVQTGPHRGYEGWDQGYYSHIISSSGPRAGNWFVWVVDDSGNRISEMANQPSDGPGGNCNQFTADFDSR